MRSWDELTEAGRIRRLRQVAWRAIDSYAIRPTRLRLVGGFTNVIYRVDTVDGPYALRVDLHQDHSDEDVDIELGWLEALAVETDLDVCRVVAARDGRRRVAATVPGVPGPRRCLLFDWIPGRPLGERLSSEAYHRLGRLAAGLHDHGATYRPERRPMVWDRVFYWPEEVDPVVIFSPEMAHRFTGGRRATLERAIAATTTAFDRLDWADAQIIHGDLHPDNVHVAGRRLIAFDFEDVMWGFPVQDVAISLFYERTHPGYADFRAAFEEGYATVRPWPVTYDGELEHFMAARTVSFVNYVANLQDDPSDYYDVAFPRLERFVADWAG